MKLCIGFIKDTGVELQEKTFKDEISAIEWCRKNCNKIDSINGLIYPKWMGISPAEFWTSFKIADAIRGNF